MPRYGNVFQFPIGSSQPYLSSSKFCILHKTRRIYHLDSVCYTNCINFQDWVNFEVRHALTLDFTSVTVYNFFLALTYRHSLNNIELVYSFSISEVISKLLVDFWVRACNLWIPVLYYPCARSCIYTLPCQYIETIHCYQEFLLGGI